MTVHQAAGYDLAGVDDVVELAPQEHDEQRGAEEPEPERRRDAELAREEATDRCADHDAADQADRVDAGHAAQQLVRYRALADHRGRRAPHERVGAEHDHRQERDRG